MSDTIEVFISYSKQDKELRDGLLAHLRPLEREGIITWHDRQILPGTRWDEEIKARLNTADIILLLISADFLATDYCTQVEIPEALRRHEAGEATVMPVILRSCGWKYTPLAAIQAYPEKAKPVVSWTDIDEAYGNVTDVVYLAATEIKKRRSQQPQANRQQKQPINIDTDDLRSGRGIDYTHLQNLLKSRKWREADQETVKRMCEAIGRQEGWFRVRDIEQFPCADLRTIDQLWVKYSNGRFGFSIQKQIWEACDSPKGDNPNWVVFGDAVGWKRKRFLSNVIDIWKYSEDLTFRELNFNILAPKGHLPSITGFIAGFWFVGSGYDDGINWLMDYRAWKSGSKLFSRVIACKL